MFFLVTHTWGEMDDDLVSSEMIRLFYNCHYGKVGNPWPKLFFVWQDPRQRRITALWESSTLPMLKDAYVDRKGFQAEFTNVKQLYPPHPDCYGEMKLVTKPNLPMKG